MIIIYECEYLYLLNLEINFSFEAHMLHERKWTPVTKRCQTSTGVQTHSMCILTKAWCISEMLNGPPPAIWVSTTSASITKLEPMLNYKDKNCNDLRDLLFKMIYDLILNITLTYNADKSLHDVSQVINMLILICACPERRGWFEAEGKGERF
jgi:hypothetical protein